MIPGETPRLRRSSFCKTASAAQLPSPAALSDDQREEFKPRWQRSIGIKWLETAPFFVCTCRDRMHGDEDRRPEADRFMKTWGSPPPPHFLIKHMPPDIDTLQPRYRRPEIHTISHIGHSSHRLIRRPVAAGRRPVFRKGKSKLKAGDVARIFVGGKK